MATLILQIIAMIGGAMYQESPYQIGSVYTKNEGHLTQNVRKTIADIRKYTPKPIYLYHISEFPDPSFQNFKNYLGISINRDDKIEIWVSDEFEHVLIHELLHVLIYYEGFPSIYRDSEYIREKIGFSNIKLIENLQMVLSSTIDHQIIFNRIKKNFDLSVDEYFEAQVKRKSSRFEKPEKKSNKYLNFDVFYRQQDLLVLFDLKNWGDYSNGLMTKYSNSYPDLYKFFLEINKTIEEIGFSTPQSTKESADIILKSIISFGEQQRLDNSVNNLWRSLYVE